MDKLAELAEISAEIGSTEESDYQYAIKVGKDLAVQKFEIEQQLQDVEMQCIADYMNESDKIKDLFQRVTSCDQILENLETILCKFQADLGNICQEIISLHEQTVSLNRQLKNKEAIKSKLSQFIEEITIPQAVTHNVMYTPAHDPKFSEHLVILHQKIHFFREQDFRDAMSCNDINQIIHGLKSKAIFKIREFILRKIGECKKYFDEYKYTTNGNKIPQHALLQNKFFYQFLLAHEKERAREVQTEYIETMSKVYLSFFRDYIYRLCKLEFDDKPDEYDLMAADDHSRTRTNIFTSKPASLKSKSTVFTLGTRSSVIKEDLESPLINPVASKQDNRYTPEMIFRTIHYALLEYACQEFTFIQEFFITSGEKQTAELFNNIFVKSLTLIYSHFNEQFKISFDTIAIFLCLHLVYRYQAIAVKRKIMILNNYWDSIVRFLYPRFEKLVQMHMRSVKNCDCDKLSGVDTMPHPVTRRYAEFASAISSINDTYPDEKVSFLLIDLQNEVKNFILRTAAMFRQPREQLVFMINNYDHILNVFKRSNIKENSKDIEEIKLQLDKRIHEIVEELLYPHFGSMICFVKDCEVYLERDDQEALKQSEGKVIALIEGFNQNWQQALNEISKGVMTWFSNFENGNKIQQATLAQLLQYHMRFQKILGHSTLKDSANKTKLIGLQELMVFVKRYKTNF